MGLLYEIDHGIACMRRLARDIQVLTGQNTVESGVPAVPLLDVVRVAASGIEHYGRLHMGPIADRALFGHVADDVASVLAALLDNATRQSSAPALIDTRSSGDGSLLLRIKDSGPGMDPVWVEKLNRTFAGSVPPMSALNGRRTGFAVAHRLACQHGLGVALVCRRAAEAAPGRTGRAGTVAMVTIPPHLLCADGQSACSVQAAGVSGSSEPLLRGRDAPRARSDVSDRPCAPTSFADDVAAFSAAIPGNGPLNPVNHGYRRVSPSSANRSGGTTT
ncbi:hypothetical protein BJF79_08640 [Actinomadura sp. CNU-125]|nr:hypothetical protein BJF79_08640 [Actinomadura sp. CNU-125]